MFRYSFEIVGYFKLMNNTAVLAIFSLVTSNCHKAFVNFFDSQMVKHPVTLDIEQKSVMDFRRKVVDSRRDLVVNNRVKFYVFKKSHSLTSLNLL